MRKRMIAMLLCASILTGCAGCGSNAPAGGNQAVTTEAAADAVAETETEPTGGANQTATALSLMQEVNGTDSRAVDGVAYDDNYRTWYEVFVYSYYDSDGDGVGDLNGLTQKLDYINDGNPDTDTDLGCDGIWLMPVMPSTTYHKYDVTDYCDIDPEYGTLEDFDTFIGACHDRGIHVILDLVMNHTSSKHPWFVSATEYLKGLAAGEEPDSTECPYVDYYHFSREQESGYTRLEGTDWYYEAQFWSEMPDLNLSSEAVRQEFEQIVDFWLARGVDGFRLDAAKEYETGSVDGNIGVLSWFNEMVKGKKDDAYLVAEVWTDMDIYAKYYASGIDSCFDFAFANKDGVIASVVNGRKSAVSYGTTLEKLQDTVSAYSDSYIDAPFYCNHDMARSAGYYAGDYSGNQTKIGQAMNLLMSGSAFLYYGEELGMKGSGKDENKRAPMYWDADDTAEGMCDGPADMDEVKMKYASAAEQMEDGDSIYQFVKEAIKLRNKYPAIARGTVECDESASGENICVIKKSYEDEWVVLVFNVSAESQSVALSDLATAGTGALQIGGVLLTTTETATIESGTLTLPPYSVVVLK